MDLTFHCQVTDKDLYIGDAQMAHIDGTLLSDIIFGGASSDVIHPGASNDTVWAGNGDDVVDDSVSHSYFKLGPGGVLLLMPGIGTGGNDTFHGGSGRDTLIGHFGADRLYGDSGDDVLRGGVGADVLHGGAGKDRLYGEAGDDTFVFTSATESLGISHDVIQGFDRAGPVGFAAPGVARWAESGSRPDRPLGHRRQHRRGGRPVIPLSGPALRSRGPSAGRPRALGTRRGH